MLYSDCSALHCVYRGKVRDIYEIKWNRKYYLLFVATDRVSAFDVVMVNGMEGPEKLLTRISSLWFQWLTRAFPSLPHHFVTDKSASTFPIATA